MLTMHWTHDAEGRLTMTWESNDPIVRHAPFDNRKPRRGIMALGKTFITRRLLRRYLSK